MNKGAKILFDLKKLATQILPEGGTAILFGSRARGDAKTESDWDLLILINTDRITGEDFDKYAYPFVDYGWSIGEQINPLIYSYSEWNSRSFTPFYKNVQTEGITLWS